TYNLSRGEAEIREFEIGKYPVTNRWFAEFVEDGGYDNLSYWTEQGKIWLDYTGAKNSQFWHDRQWICPNAPVIGVCWYEAYAFTKWLTENKKDGYIYRLPDENEWEAAAAGFEKREYPWGNGWKDDYCNSEECGIKRTSPVGIFLNGDTPEGISDLAGNVWEWTDSDFFSEEKLKDFEFNEKMGELYNKYEKSIGKDDNIKDQLISKLNEEERKLPVVRGGSWLFNPDDTWCVYSYCYDPDYRSNHVGFRCVRSVTL
ncbi:MAG: formylglycine-generating enzyme family protein, partial [bacterium]|nr:formylglycine-generating enzyme family protein [bacterium]